MTGQAIFHYRILEKLGAGGMDEVFEADDIHLGPTVASERLRLGQDILELRASALQLLQGRLLVLEHFKDGVQLRDLKDSVNPLVHVQQRDHRSLVRR